MFGYIAVWLSRGYRYFLRVVSLIVGLHTSMPPHTVGVLVPEAEMNSKIQQEIARKIWHKEPNSLNSETCRLQATNVTQASADWL